MPLPESTSVPPMRRDQVVTEPPVTATVTLALSLALTPLSSVTVSMALYAPALAYACVGFMPLPLVPSPKVQAQPVMVPSGSDEPLPSRVTATPGAPLVSAPALAIGARSATVIAAVSDAEAPRLSMTVRVAVYVPGVA